MTPKQSYTCPKCSKNFERDFWSITDQKKFKGFCSRKCSNSHVQTKEMNGARREKARLRSLDPTGTKRILRDFTCPACQKQITKAFEGSYQAKISKGFCSQTCVAKHHAEKTHKARSEKAKTLREGRSFDSFHFDTRRRLVIAEQQGRCGECGLSEWRGKPLILEIDHINGDHSDHSRENLVGLCPNCHSLTPTWRGRNKPKFRKRVPDEQLLQALANTPNITQALRKVGMTPKGANYKRANALLYSTKASDAELVAAPVF